MRVIQALSGFTRQWFTPDDQDPARKLVRFQVEPLDGEQYSDVAYYFRKDENGTIRITAAGQRICLEYGLKAWENFQQGNVPVPFMLSNFRLLPFEVRQEICSKIISISNLSEDEIKN